MLLDHKYRSRPGTIISFCLLAFAAYFVYGDEPSPVFDDAIMADHGWDIQRGSADIEWVGIKITAKQNVDPQPITAIGRESQSKAIGDDLIAIGKLQALQAVIDLSGSFDDRYVAAISRDAPLRALLIPGAKITDDGIAKLASFPGLEHLDLAFCAITDKSISTLSRLKYLRSLNIFQTMISDSERAKLEQALPNCEIYEFGWRF